MVTASMVKELRERTMQADGLQRALQDTNGAH